MDFEKMAKMAQGMKDIKAGSNDSDISKDEAEDLNYLGLISYEDQDYALAADLWEKAAEAGNADAMYNLADSYENGEGVEKNNYKAFEWYKKAALLGNVDAMFSTGIYLYKGEYTSKDLPEAFAWCKKAAENGNVNAMNWTACLYRDGEGVMQDFDRAKEWFEKSANGGNNYAALHLGNMYTKRNNAKSLDLAIKWLTKAAEAGNVDAMYRLGTVYELRADIYYSKEEFDMSNEYYSRRWRWYEKAAELGNIPAKEWISSHTSSCFITTAVCDSFGKPDDCYELTAFRNFRDKWLINQPDGKSLVAQYYEIAPKIVAAINKLPAPQNIYNSIWSEYLQLCLKFIEAGENLKCKNIYTRMVNNLKEKFLT